MSWSTCYSGSNNVHFNYPPLMSDGRNWSSWLPDAVINNRIRNQENIKTSWDYRRFLTNHGLEIMKYNTMEACYTLGLDPHVSTDKTPSGNVPYVYKGTFDTGKPGFGYCNSDLKNPYLNREQLYAKMISPSIYYGNPLG
jgi:hypothetical protein